MPWLAWASSPSSTEPLRVSALRVTIDLRDAGRPRWSIAGALRLPDCARSTRRIVKQLRERGQSAVIFDLTGAFVESFYNPETDVILNPMDQRCRPWTIFNDCDIYADFLSAATALIPSDPGDKEPFWQLAARTLFVEICIKLIRGASSSRTRC